MERIDGQENIREKKICKYRKYKQGQARSDVQQKAEIKALGTADTSTLNQLEIILRLLQKLFENTVRKK